MLEAALPIFLLTYALVSISRLRGVQINRPVAALFGAALMVVFGVLLWNEALGAVADGLEILALLLGMMVMVATLEAGGFFEYLAEQLVKRSRGHRHFFVEVCVASAILSALILNDAVVLLLTPVIIKTCRRLGTHPIPYLMGETICANIGSTATLVGNPQNAYIGITSGISFVRYAAIMAPITALCLAVAVWMMLRFFSKDFAAAPGPGAAAPAQPAHIDKALLSIAAVVFCAVLALFVLSSSLHLSIAAIAMGGGVFMLFATVAHRGFKVESVLGRVDWTILLLFCGLFVVLRGIEKANLMGGFVDSVASVGSGGADPVTIGWLGVVSAALSNLISNVPAVLLLAPVAASLGSEKAWLILASSSTLAGNATLLGAAANLITAQVARGQGYEFSWVRFSAIGLPVSFVTLVISTLAIAYLPL